MRTASFLQMYASNYSPTGTLLSLVKELGQKKFPHNIHTCMYTSLLSKYMCKCCIKGLLITDVLPSEAIVIGIKIFHRQNLNLIT